MPKPSILRVPFSSLTYSPDVARYRAPSGRFIGPETVQKIMIRDLDATAERLANHARRAQRGEITVDEWLKLHCRELKVGMLGSVASAKGGIHALNQSDYGRAGQLTKEQYAFARAKAEKAAADPDYLQSEAFVRESASYANSFLPAYEAQRLIEEKASGYDWEYNELDDGAAHCKPKGDKESCLEQTEKGVVPVGTLVRYGGCVCGGHCRCGRRRFKTKAAAEFAFAATKSIRQLVPLEMYS